MTLDTYSHMLPSMQQEAMDKLNGLFDRDGLDDEDVGGGQSN